MLENVLKFLGTVASPTATPAFIVIVNNCIRNYYGLFGNLNRLCNLQVLSLDTTHLQTFVHCLRIVFLCRDSRRLTISRCNIDLQSILPYHIQIAIRL